MYKYRNIEARVRENLGVFRIVSVTGARQVGGVNLTFWRSHAGGEADVLIEWQGEVVAVEVKSGRRIDARDLKGLRECRQALGGRFRRGVVMYGGHESQGLEDRILALPISCLLGWSDGRQQTADQLSCA